MKKGLTGPYEAYSSGRPATPDSKIVTLGYYDPQHSMYNNAVKECVLDVEFTKHVSGDYFTIQMTERMQNAKGVVSSRTISCTLRHEDRKRVALFMLEGMPEGKPSYDPAEGIKQAVDAFADAAGVPRAKVTASGSVECPHCHWGFAPSAIAQHIREKHQ